jgi:hypothetical protein
MSSVTLKWMGPYPFSKIMRGDGIPSEFNGSGVYVWINRKLKRISYVGKADTHTLLQRQYDWYFKGISGQSLIPGDRPKEYFWNLADRRKVAETITDEGRYVDLVRIAFRYMANYDVHIASLSDKETIRQAEQMLLYSLQPDDTRSPTTQPKSNFDLVHEASPWLGAEFSGQVRAINTI